MTIAIDLSWTTWKDFSVCELLSPCDDCTLCSPSVRGELLHCILILSASYAEVLNCEVRILATERITWVKGFTLSWRTSSTKFVYQLFRRTHFFKIWPSLCDLFFVRRWVKTRQSFPEHPAEFVAWDPVLRYKTVILVKVLGTRQGNNLNLITSKKKCHQLK